MLGCIKKEFMLPIGLDTDVNASAIGEATYGVTKGLDSSIYITVGTGIGVGVILDGKAVHGMQHPEAGHILLSRHTLDGVHITAIAWRDSHRDRLLKSVLEERQRNFLWIPLHGK